MMDPMVAALLRGQGVTGQAPGTQVERAMSPNQQGMPAQTFPGARGAIQMLGGDPLRPGQGLNLSDPRTRSLISALMGGSGGAGEGLDRQFMTQAQLAGRAR